MQIILSNNNSICNTDTNNSRAQKCRRIDARWLQRKDIRYHVTHAFLRYRDRIYTYTSERETHSLIGTYNSTYFPKPHFRTRFARAYSFTPQRVITALYFATSDLDISIQISSEKYSQPNDKIYAKISAVFQTEIHSELIRFILIHSQIYIRTHLS